MCDPCVSGENHNCGFCLSSLECLAGDSDGPSSGVPCDEWIHTESEGGGLSCPVDPQCSSRADCYECTIVDECAWCASEFACMTTEETFVNECRGTVYDLPCPESFIANNRIVGNLYVEPDSVFGGGELVVTGTTADGDDFGVEFTGDEMTVVFFYSFSLSQQNAPTVIDLIATLC